MRSLTTSALTAAALILTALPAVAGNWYGLISAGLGTPTITTKRPSAQSIPPTTKIPLTTQTTVMSLPNWQSAAA